MKKCQEKSITHTGKPAIPAEVTPNQAGGKRFKRRSHGPQVDPVRLAVLLLALAAFVAGCGVYSILQQDQLRGELSAALARAALNNQGYYVRHALLLVDAPDNRFHYTTAGWTDRLDNIELILPSRQFLITDITQAMTATIIYQLAEEGHLGAEGVDARLADLHVLPSEVLEEIHRMDGRSYASAITVRHLLTHTSGLRDVYFDSVEGPVSALPPPAARAAPDSLFAMGAFTQPWTVWDYAAWQADPGNGRAGLLNYYLAGMNNHALSAPGEDYHFSRTNYLLLGLLIEEVTENSLHQELRSRIFDRLGMADSYLLGADDPPTAGYEGQLAEVQIDRAPASSQGADFSLLWAAGGVVSSTEDLLVFTRALLEGRLFQSPLTLQEMLRAPADIEGAHHSSGLIRRTTEDGEVVYMASSNGSWVTYFEQRNVVTVGTRNSFDNPVGNFWLQSDISQTLNRNGLENSLTVLGNVPSRTALGAMGLWLLLMIVWWLSASFGRNGSSERLQLLRRLATAALLVNLVGLLLIGLALRADIYQLLLGLTREVNLMRLVVGGVMAAFGVAIAGLSVRTWRREEGTSLERWLATGGAMALLVYGLALVYLNS